MNYRNIPGTNDHAQAHAGDAQECGACGLMGCEGECEVPMDVCELCGETADDCYCE